MRPLPHVSAYFYLSSTRIRRIQHANPHPLNPLSKLKTFEYAKNLDTFEQSNPHMFLSNDVTKYFVFGFCPDCDILRLIKGKKQNNNEDRIIRIPVDRA